MTCWEYCWVETVDRTINMISLSGEISQNTYAWKGGYYDSFLPVASRLGSEGWEMVGFEEYTFWFKRPIKESSEK